MTDGGTMFAMSYHGAQKIVPNYNVMGPVKAARAPLGDLVDTMDVGFTCAYLATPYARRITGTTLYVDGGVNIMA